MSNLHNKQILVGVTGGIAAYKVAELIRLLRREGARVRVVMTEAAQAFITPLTLQALSGNPVHTHLLDPDAEAGMGHIELARWADLLLIAPASADFMARLSTGQANDLLTTLCLASSAPIALAPAMNQAMWRNAATVANAQTLSGRGVLLWGPDDGQQACGDVGPGRMLAPEALLARVEQCFAAGVLTGKTVVITAGPTREPLDPVRYLSNNSSGKMGYALAQAALEAGARTILISGPSHLQPPHRAEYVAVMTAQEMLEASLKAVVDADVFIATAAVADYRPAERAAQKMKKNNDHQRVLDLVANPDIVATIAQLKPKPFIIGFAAETHDLAAYAQEKRQRKGLDWIVANDVSNSRIGFNSDNNAVTLFRADSEPVEFSERSKDQLARDLIALMAQEIAGCQNH